MRSKFFAGLLMVIVVAAALPAVTIAVSPQAHPEAVARPGGGRGRNTAPVVTITEPVDGATVSGTVTIAATATDAQDGTLTPSIYIDDVFMVTANTYEWDTTAYSDGAHTIKATATDSGGLTGTDIITVYVNNGGGEPPSGGDGIVNRYAVVVGISDYYAINDLTYCDEDATDWYYYLDGLGYQITLLGDGTNWYPQFDGLATEYNVKQALQNMIAQADEDDIIVFASSGHGTYTTFGTGRNRYYKQALCMWDTSAGQNGEDGLLYDDELAAIMAAAVSHVFIFLDHCFSGGMDEVMANANANLIYMTTTCTDSGYGYDVPEYENGAWTYWFLEAGLVGQGFTDMESCYDWASAQYPYTGADAPQEFDGDPATPFTL